MGRTNGSGEECRRLEIVKCGGVEEEALLNALAAGLPKLETLSVDGMGISDNWLVKSAPHLTNLRQLSISLCGNVTDRGLCAVTAACPKLARLTANDVFRLTDATLVALAEHCPHLQVLIGDLAATLYILFTLSCSLAPLQVNLQQCCDHPMKSMNWRLFYKSPPLSCACTVS